MQAVKRILERVALFVKSALIKIPFQINLKIIYSIQIMHKKKKKKNFLILINPQAYYLLMPSL